MSQHNDYYDEDAGLWINDDDFGDQCEDCGGFYHGMTCECQWECAFPESCLMPGYHAKSECHTVEMIEAYERSVRDER